MREDVLEKRLCIFAFSEGVEVENELHTNCIICSLCHHQLLSTNALAFDAFAVASQLPS